MTSICSSNSLYKKQFRRFWQSWRQVSKQMCQRFRRPQPVLPSLLRPNCQEGVDSRLSSTPTVATKKKGGEDITKRTFLAATIVVQVNKKKRLLFFSLKFRVWVFLFLRIPFFKTQLFGPMVQMLMTSTTNFYILQLKNNKSRKLALITYLEKIDMKSYKN